MTKCLILECYVVSEIYPQEQEVNTGRTGIFLSAFDNSVHVPVAESVPVLLFSETRSWFFIYKQGVDLVLVFSA